MKNWILRKVFYSKIFKNLRRGHWLDGYYEGKIDQQFNQPLKGLDKK